VIEPPGLSPHQERVVNGKKLTWLCHPYLEGMWQMVDREAPSMDLAVELGTNNGRWASELLRRFPASRLKRLVCIDTWPHPENYEAWVESCGSDQRAVPVQARTADIAPKFLAAYGSPIDLLYVDAAHNFDAVSRDLRDWVPLVRKGGLVLCDDYSMGGVRKAIIGYLTRTGHVHVLASGRWGGDLRDRNRQGWFRKVW
jgi:predicted O-methyltransferase YrrM